METNDPLLAVKSEPNEMFYSTHSSERPNQMSTNFPVGEYKSEPSSTGSITAKKEQNVFSVPTTETPFMNHIVTNTNIGYFAPISSPHPLNETKMSVATKFEISVLENVPRIEENSPDANKSNDCLKTVSCKLHKKAKNHKSKAQLELHINATHHECDLCAKSFKRKDYLVKHLKCHTAERNHKCDACAKTFKSKNEVVQHMKCHTDERNHKCEVCDRTYKRRGDVVKHMKCHTDERHFKCDTCTKSFKSRYEAANHMKYHADERNHKCGVCGKSFKTRSNLVDHTKYHSDERNQRCDICGKTFKMRHQLVKHDKCHTDERNHKCHVCDKSFKTRGTLSSHLIYHTVERNHSCGVCTKCFKTRRDVVKHMKCHADERNHKCDGCTKSFRTRHEMVVHMKRHIERKAKCGKKFKSCALPTMKRYKCEQSKRFKARNLVVKHLKQHAEEYFEGNVRGMVLSYENDLKDHIKCEDVKDSIQKLSYSRNIFDEKAKKPNEFIMEECNTSIKEEKVKIHIENDIMDSNCATSKRSYFYSGAIEVKTEPTEIIQVIKLENGNEMNL